MPAQYKVRVMNRKDLDLAIEWAAQEGWNPGHRDAECFSKLDPTGFFVGEVASEPVSIVSAVKYDNDFGFIGLYIVAPKFRGQGYGIQIWNHAMNYLAGRNIGLDGVIEQQNNYKKSGFNLAYRNVRYGGRPHIKKRLRDEHVIELSANRFEDLERYDQQIFPYDRRSFIRCWVQQFKGAALGFLGSDGELAGYGVLRPCRKGFKLAPLFADTPEIAECLFDELAGRAGDSEIFYDPPEPNDTAIELALQHNLKPIFETARMYTNSPPKFPLQRVFSSTTFEVG